MTQKEGSNTRFSIHQYFHSTNSNLSTKSRMSLAIQKSTKYSEQLRKTSTNTYH